jgi:tetratricopeptide (TPR) repeat protein
MGLVAVAVFLWWETQEGGYAPTAWYPGAAVFLGLFVAALVAARSRAPGEWPRRAMLLFAAFTGWCFLSILWAGVQGDAWDGANRTLLYFTVYATFALIGWRAREAGIFLALFALGTALIGATTFIAEGASAFIDGRLAAPTGYANASAALFIAAFWPAVALASRPEVHWVARAVLMATGGVLVQLTVLAQSRGSVVAGVVALAVYVLLSERRLRAVLMLVPIAAVTLASLDPLLSVFASGSGAELDEAVAGEQKALALATMVLLAAGAVIGILDRPGAIDRRRRPQVRRRRRAVLALAAVLAAVGAAVVGIGLWSLSGHAQGSGPESALESTRFGGLETGRFEMWRVASETVVDRPLLGAGVDNFAVDFVRERSTYEEPLYPHSLVLRAFSQTGLVGGGLFLAFLAAALLAAVRPPRRSDGLTNALAAAAIASAVYWLVHASLDWLWEIPVLAAPALAFLGLACGRVQSRSRRLVSSRVRSLPGRAAAAALGAVALGSYLFPGLAAAELERAVAAWPAAREQASSRLDWARRLNPLSERPDVVAANLALRAGQPDRARIAFTNALERNPDDWFVHLQLALLDAAAGMETEALAHLRHAEALNPLEPTILAARDRLFDEALRRQLFVRADRLAVRSPLGRRPVDCRPVLGIGSSCPWSRAL